MTMLKSKKLLSFDRIVMTIILGIVCLLPFTFMQNNTASLLNNASAANSGGITVSVAAGLDSNFYVQAYDESGSIVNTVACTVAGLTDEVLVSSENLPGTYTIKIIAPTFARLKVSINYGMSDTTSLIFSITNDASETTPLEIGVAKIEAPVITDKSWLTNFDKSTTTASQ